MEDKEIMKKTSVDHITSVIKSALGSIPIAGPFLAEMTGTIIPNQRIDRIAKFAEELEGKLQSVEEESLRSHLTDENFTDTVEETLRQAARSTSDERRKYIANLLLNGIQKDSIDFIETKHLLKLLNEINDIEVILLFEYFYRSGYPEEESRVFLRKHRETLQPLSPTARQAHSLTE